VHPIKQHPAAARRLTVATMMSTLLLVPAAVAAQAPDRIDLPNGWAPEGITTDGTSLFVGSLADGSIWRGDPATGEGDVLAEGAEGRVAAGIESEPDAGRIWAAGGDTGEVRAYDSESGELLATYSIEAGFLNDVVATPDAVYVTDSFVPQLIVIPLGADGALPEPDAAEALPISGELEYVEGFNVNGIVSSPAGLVVVHSTDGELFRVDPATGEASRIDIGEASVTAGDGLELDGRTLYVVRNRLNQVAAFELDEGATAAVQVAELTSPDLDVPTTVAVLGFDLWAVNARDFGQGPPETEYWITRLDAPAGDAEAMDDAGEMSEDGE
jgi:sugar lactone lactonase YvrE